ncbi:MAG: hypothetical protein R6U98_07350, partial [Pirellulaceae bacterium]
EEFLYDLIEELTVKMFAIGGISLPRPFARMTWAEAMDTTGTDRPCSEMRNHLHVVLRPCPGAAKRLSAVEVARRWLTIRKLAKCMTDELPVPDERRVQALAKDKKRIKTPRKQPGSISWFMAILSENIARRANREDACRGRFWCLKVRGKSRTENLWDPVPSPENAKGG